MRTEKVLIPEEPANLIAAPDDPRAWPAWRARLEAWSREARATGAHAHAGAGSFDWVGRCITTHKILLWDERFRGRDTGTYRVEAYVDSFERRFGVLDGVILWHAYPNLGFDRRNQFDFWRGMPGGLRGMREVVDRLHACAVRVILAYNPWDRKTRPEGRDDHACLADLVGELDADGLYLDTLSAGVPELRAALDAVKPGVVLQSQAYVPIERLGDHHMSWAEVWRDSRVPGVLRNRFLDRGHMMHVVHRWMADHGPEMQLAWMNGAGMVVWENIFGSWNGWRDRDAVQSRLMSRVRHHWYRHFVEGVWTPLVMAPAAGVYASCWDHGGVRLWTLVNRNGHAVTNVRLPVSAAYASDPMAGRELDIVDRHVSIDLPGNGLGAVIEDRIATEFLEGQAELCRQRDFASGTAPLVEVRSRPPVPAVPSGEVPQGMVAIAGGPVVRRTRYRLRECGMYASAGAPGCDDRVLPGLHSEKEALFRETLAPFAIDKRSVTTSQYERFIEETGYRPGVSEAFLAPSGRPDEPVCQVDLDDARAYASWLGRRLPTAAEWQKAAEEGLLEEDAVRVWNWTEPEMSDGRTRFCMVKGGSDEGVEGSEWYADGGPKDAAFSAKYLLLWPGLDRCATIGFRSAVDLDRRSGVAEREERPCKR